MLFEKRRRYGEATSALTRNRLKEPWKGDHRWSLEASEVRDYWKFSVRKEGFVQRTVPDWSLVSCFSYWQLNRWPVADSPICLEWNIWIFFVRNSLMMKCIKKAFVSVQAYHRDSKPNSFNALKTSHSSHSTVRYSDSVRRTFNVNALMLPNFVDQNHFHAMASSLLWRTISLLATICS